ncbi:type I secretion system permease/ATPase [Parasphingopyxis sp.]|uniref:type I secretion system permease/ATPase n=1 Tax=Parasphingopyxis sp. TaxID=1920299 RepID=UPI0026319871|nr:type I secretion system permease/ATPase [Parasphingopyxis sp.]
MNHERIIEERKPRFSRWLSEPMLANKSVYLKVAIAAAMINLFGLATALFTMTVYDRVVPNNATDSLIALSIGLAIVILFDFILRTLRAYFVDIAGAQIDRDIGHTVFERLLNIRLDLKKGSTGALAGLMRELETLRDFFASATISAIVDIPFILLTLLVIFLIGGAVVIVPALVVPLVIGVSLACQPALERMARKSMGEGLLKQTVLVETIGGLETVKASNAGPLLTERWLDSIERHSDYSLRQRLIAAISVNTAAMAQTISYAGVVIIGVSMINNQTLSLGGLIACSILAGRAVAPLGQIASLLTRISMTRIAYRQINELVETPVEGSEENALQLSDLEGRIEFRKVDFRYPGAPEKALEDVSFVIEPGEHIAILGRVGSGKSTIAKLIIGLFPPEDGIVMIDGTDIRQIAPSRMRTFIGSAMQDNILLSGSVRENIMLARADIDDAEMLRASKISGTHQFMGKVVNGYDLRLADRGEGLSGGQRQSIAIARAIAGKPPMFVFDEPTSAMDAETEAGLLDRITPELEGRTLVLITHRPPMLRLVSRIILMSEGKIIADGPRDAILRKIQGDQRQSIKNKEPPVRQAKQTPNITVRPSTKSGG